MSTEQNLSSVSRKNVPRAADAILMLIVFLLVSVAMAGVYAIISENKTVSEPKNAAQMLYAVFFSHIIGILLPMLVYMKIRNFSFRKTLNLKPVSFKSLFWATIISIFFFVGINLLQSALEPLLTPFKNDISTYNKYFEKIVENSRSGMNLFMLIISISVIPAVTEELLFRGIMLNGFRNSSGVIRAVILSGLLFGIIHFLPFNMIAISLLGIFLGIVMVKTRSIYTAMWCHFMNNTLTIISMLYLQQ